jgi:hypothetical protein
MGSPEIIDSSIALSPSVIFSVNGDLLTRFTRNKSPY